VSLSRISYLVKLQLSETYRGAARHCARWKCTIVQLVSFSLMPYRVDENDDGRGNFDRAFPRRNWNCAWIIMNASSSEPMGPTTIEGERRVQIYLHIFHRSSVTQPTHLGVALFASVMCARYLRDRKNKYLQSVWNILFNVCIYPFFHFFMFASETVKNTELSEEPRALIVFSS